jgi:hypothetical protein
MTSQRGINHDVVSFLIVWWVVISVSSIRLGCYVRLGIEYCNQTVVYVVVSIP